LAPSPLRLAEIFFNWTLAVILIMNIIFDKRLGLSLMNRLRLLSSVLHIYHVIENSSFSTICKSSVSPDSAKHIVPILCIWCYNDCLVTWTVVSLTTAKFKPLIFSMSGFALSYTVNMFSLLILYDFCLLPAQFHYIIVYIWKVESCANHRLVCTLENLQWCGKPCFAGAAILRGRCLPLIPKQGKHKSLLTW
jgi:hypothetical protein